VRCFLGKAKDIILRPISRQDADAVVKRVHYSGKVVNNSQFHVGVFYAGKLEGAMQFGPSLDKRKIQPLVGGTLWNEFIELNRMAFSEALPRNSESRALGIAMRMLKKHAPHLQWVISFADGAQCGDGTIYRAAGFVLTGIKENNQIWAAPDGETQTRMVLTDTRRPARGRELDKISRSSFTMQGNNGALLPRRAVVARVSSTKGSNIQESGGASMKPFIEAGYKPIPGYQLRYIYFLDPTARERLTVPILPYSEIERRGAGMYKGQPRATSIDSDAPGVQPGDGGATPTVALQNND
jgi:hypothetical protein